MGYLKNQLIASQTEVGDRVPAPKPASSHVAFWYHEPRKLVRARERSAPKFHWSDVAGWSLFSLCIGLAAGIIMGVYFG